MQEIKFATPLGQPIYNALFKPFKAPASVMFLPRRTAFVYDLDEQEVGSDVPTTLRRSKEDCPPVSSSFLHKQCLTGLSCPSSS